MIIIRLRGGMGNQLFQYAAARALSLRHGVPLRFDMEWFVSRPSGDIARPFILHHFDVVGSPANRHEIFATRCHAAGRNDSLLMRLRVPFMGLEWGWYREPHFHYDPGVTGLGKDACLDGYWQSPAYFAEHSDTIRRELSVKSPLAGHNARLADEISSCCSVAVHVRRGDYVSDPSVNGVHGTCSPDYYASAVSLLRARIGVPHCFVFSDDPTWVRQSLDLPSPITFVDCNGTAEAHEELRLMTLCRHHVIANSSFSWWGAWLCRHPDKVVVAPARWFNDPSARTDDLIPAHWLRL